MASVVELLHVQKLVSQTRMEALGDTILPGTAWLDIQRLNPQQLQPLPNRFRNELGAVVTSNMPGSPVNHKQL